MPILHRDSWITPRALDLFILAEQVHTQFPAQGGSLRLPTLWPTLGSQEGFVKAERCPGLISPLQRQKSFTIMTLIWLGQRVFSSE